MRLLDTTTLELHEFPDATRCPSYAILSHVWMTGSESTLQDLIKFQEECRVLGVDPHGDLSSIKTKIADKLIKCCAFASANGYRYIWVDTCCIDKTSSAELSEAINSMGEWYAKADVCYVYLHDVDAQENPRRLGSRFRRCKWFTRGWTLQELLFPDRVVFLSSDWQTSLGTKTSLCQEIEETTGIASDVLAGRRDMQSVCVAVRMSWASRRETTRLEDEAYCLLGIFGIHLPTIYGEGRNAFTRLQEEIFKKTLDQSLFAWGLSAVLRPANAPRPFPFDIRPLYDRMRNRSRLVHQTPPPKSLSPLLAISPAFFADCAAANAMDSHTLRGNESIPGWSSALSGGYSITPLGLRAQLPILPLSILFDGCQCSIALLACQDIDGRFLGLVISPYHPLSPRQTHSEGYRIGPFSCPHRHHFAADATSPLEVFGSPNDLHPDIRVVYIDPGLIGVFRRKWTQIRAREIWIRVGDPRKEVPTWTPYDETTHFSADTSPTTTLNVGVPPWLHQHANDWGFRLDVQERTPAGMLAPHSDALSMRILRDDGRGLWITVHLPESVDNEEWTTEDEYLKQHLRVAVFGGQMISRGPTTDIAAITPLGPYNENGLYVWQNSWAEILPLGNTHWSERMYDLESIACRIRMNVMFWTSSTPLAVQAVGDPASRRKLQDYTMDITFSYPPESDVLRVQRTPPHTGWRRLKKIILGMRLGELGKRRHDPLAQDFQDQKARENSYIGYTGI